MSRRPIALLAAPLVALGLPALARAAAPPPPIDATTVVAQQLLTLAGADQHWQLDSGGITPDEVRVTNTPAPTFIVIGSGAAIVTDVSPSTTPDAPTGDSVHLGLHEATFVNGGEAARIDADASGATYLSLSLVEGAAGDGTLGGSFAVPAGLYDADLRGQMVGAGATALIPDATVGPTVVLVVSGTVTAGGAAFEAAEPFPAGAALGVEGEVLVTNAGDQPAFVVAASLAPTDPGTPATTTTTEAPEESEPAETTTAPTTTVFFPDSDGDGLDDGEEAERGTDPGSTDSDNDGLSDGEEVNEYGTDPNNNDTDGDALVDSSELTNGWGCDPTSYDTDGDGFNDHDDGEGCDDPNQPSPPPTAP